MAKPGSPAAAAIAGGVDLGALKKAAVPLSEEDAFDALRKAELKLHMRCTGCGERLGTGFEFTRLIPQRGPDGKPTVGKMTVAACNGSGAGGTCDFAAEARDGATVVRIVEYVWLDGPGPMAADEAREALADAMSDEERAAADMVAEGSPVRVD